MSNRELVEGTVKGFADYVNNFSYGEYEEDCDVATEEFDDMIFRSYGIECYKPTEDGEFDGAVVCLAFGGPWIYLDTKKKEVRGGFLGCKHSEPLEDSMGLERINDLLDEMFHAEVIKYDTDLYEN